MRGKRPPTIALWADSGRAITEAQLGGAAARRHVVTERHVRRLVAERGIPFIKWGHLLRFDPDEIEAWIDGGRHVVEEVAARRQERRNS
jgi:excisionase family DNA binding protein